MADPSSLSLPPGVRPSTEQAPPEPPAQQLPPAGAFVAGYGCWINPGYITKVEVGATGNGYQGLVWLADPTTHVGNQAAQAKITPPLDERADAQLAVDQWIQTYFVGYTVHRGGRTFWGESPAV